MNMQIEDYLRTDIMTAEQIEYALDLSSIPTEACYATQNKNHITFEISNFEFMCKKYPHKFPSPSQEVKESIKIGMSIQIKADWLIDEYCDEFFWVKITEEFTNDEGERFFYGECLNETQVLNWGTKLGPIRLRNIYNIYFNVF